MNNSIFIGSSSEGLEIANHVESFLKENSYDCHLWNGGDVFTLNQSTWDALLSTSLENDYGVFVMTKDDIIVSRGKESDAIRDNLLFEFGLFLGRLDYRKTFVLIEKGAKLPSDFNGITLSFFESTDVDSLHKSLQNILMHIQKDHSIAGLHVGPATILAMSYYDNFLYPVCCGKVEIESEQHDDFKVIVVIPNVLQDNLQNYCQCVLKNLATCIIQAPHRELQVRFLAREEKFVCDFPTQISVLHKAFQLSKPVDHIGSTEKEKALLNKHKRNFVHALRILIDSKRETRDRILIVEENIFIEEYATRN